MVQAGGNQKPFQGSVDKDAKVAGGLDEGSQGIDAGLDKGPYKGQDHSHQHHHRDQHDEHEPGAAVDLEGIVEFGFAEPVMYQGYYDAQHQSQEHAHVQNLDTQDHGLAGAA